MVLNVADGAEKFSTQIVLFIPSTSRGVAQMVEKSRPRE